MALPAAASALLGGSLAPRPGARAAWWGVVLLAALAGWAGASMLWSIAPDRTWSEVNRLVAYALLAGTAVLLGGALPRAAERFAVGWLAVVSVVALYALAGKALPGLTDQTGQLARLRGPLEYWNALGLLCVLAAPVAVRLAVERTLALRHRLIALEALLLLLVVVGLTYSRGAVAALLVAVGVISVFGTGRLRGLVALAAAVLAAAGPLAFAFTRDALTVNGAPLGDRIADGRLLGLLLLAAGVALWFGGRALMQADGRVRWKEASGRRGRRLLVGGAALLIAVSAFGLSRSPEGITGRIDQAAQDFTQSTEDDVYDPARLVSANSGNRWSWWEEAAGAWSDRPVQGWGAGSFALLHLQYRHDRLATTQAHSMPMQLLAELGVVGLVLAYGAVLALLAAAIARTRRQEHGRERDLSIALLAAAAAWLVHGLFDWDLQIPAVTAPVLVMLGLLGGRAAAAEPALAPRPAPLLGARVPLVALATLVACAFAASVALPWLAANKADGAAEIASAGTPEALADAAAQADLAARLNPLSARPLYVAAAVAGRRDRLLEARAHLLEAVDRAPRDPQTWSRLAGLAAQLADRNGFLAATRRLFALDPHNPIAEAQASIAAQFLAPPASSATATGTPLTSAG